MFAFSRCLAQANNSAFKICEDPAVKTIPTGQVLEYYDVNWSYWQYILPLLVFIVVFRTLGYITLRYFRKPLLTV